MHLSALWVIAVMVLVDTCQGLCQDFQGMVVMTLVGFQLTYGTIHAGSLEEVIVTLETAEGVVGQSQGKVMAFYLCAIRHPAEMLCHKEGIPVRVSG